MKLIQRHSRKVYLTCIVGFMYAMVIALPTYVHSSFIETAISERAVSILFILAGIVSVLMLIGFNKLLRRLGNTLLSVLVILVNIAGIMAMVFGTGWYIGVGFIASYAAATVGILCIDIFLEAASDFRSVGAVRGLYMTGANAAWVISPLITGSILVTSNYGDIYKITAGIALLVVAMIVYLFHNFKDPHYRSSPASATISSLKTHDDLRKIFVINTGLHLFYAWMVIYMPIYLVHELGFTWSQFGLLITIALLPFIIFELPLGRLADRNMTEHTYLGLGYTIMGISTCAIAFVSSTNFLVWALILFITRIGASISEIMIETYFFRHIHSDQSGILSIFRTTRQLPIVLGPLIFLIINQYLPTRYSFLVLGIIILAMVFVIKRLPPTIIHRHNHKPHHRPELPPTVIHTAPLAKNV